MVTRLNLQATKVDVRGLGWTDVLAQPNTDWALQDRGKGGEKDYAIIHVPSGLTLFIDIRHNTSLREAKHALRWLVEHSPRHNASDDHAQHRLAVDWYAYRTERRKALKK